MNRRRLDPKHDEATKITVNVLENMKLRPETGRRSRKILRSVGLFSIVLLSCCCVLLATTLPVYAWIPTINHVMRYWTPPYDCRAPLYADGIRRTFQPNGASRTLSGSFDVFTFLTRTRPVAVVYFHTRSVDPLLRLARQNRERYAEAQRALGRSVIALDLSSTLRRILPDGVDAAEWSVFEAKPKIILEAMDDHPNVDVFALHDVVRFCVRSVTRQAYDSLTSLDRIQCS